MLKIDKTTGLYYRERTSDKKSKRCYIDRSTIRDSFRDYRDLDIKPGDRILDIGGNVGGFAVYAVKLKANVLCYEPEPSNFSVLKMNTGKYNNIEIRNAALTTDERQKITLYLCRNSGSHSLISFKGREKILVNAEPIQKAYEEYKPNKIKCDCEGAEYSLFSVPFPNSVTHIAMELHLMKKDWRLYKATSLIEKIISQGFELKKAPKMNAFQATICSFERKI